MKYLFALAALIAASGLFLIGYAQIITRNSAPVTEMAFEAITLINDRGEVRTGPALYLMDVRMSNGDTCYFISTASTISELESLHQVSPAGCTGP